VDAMLRVADPDAHGLPWLSPMQPQLAVLQNCAPAERARREHAVRYVDCLQLITVQQAYARPQIDMQQCVATPKLRLRTASTRADVPSICCSCVREWRPFRRWSWRGFGKLRHPGKARRPYTPAMYLHESQLPQTQNQAGPPWSAALPVRHTSCGSAAPKPALCEGNCTW